MTDKLPLNKKEQLDFDQMELHSDINVHIPSEPEKRRKGKKASGGGGGGKITTAVLVALLVVASGAAGLTYYRYDELSKQYAALEYQVREAAENLVAKDSDLQAKSSDLVQKETTLASARTNIDRLDQTLKSAQKDIRDLEKKNRNLQKDLDKRQKDLDETNEELKRAKDELKTQRQKVRNREVARDRARRELADLEKSSSTRVTELETTLEQERTELGARIENLDADLSQARQDLRAAAAERDRLEEQFKAESQASLEIIKERSQLKRRNEDLERQVQRMQADLTATRQRARELEVVDPGDLVPFSDEVQPATVTYREPLSDGQKIPRRVGNLTAMVLITETGSVSKAYLLPGQEALEPELHAAVVRNLYSWKFTPPVFQNVRVKTWQPVLVIPE